MSDPNSTKRPNNKRDDGSAAADRALVYAANRALIQTLKPGDWIQINRSEPVIFIGLEFEPTFKVDRLILIGQGYLYSYLLTDQLAALSAVTLPRVDLSQPSLKRLVWWMRYAEKNKPAPSYYPPCPCCGYPNLGDDDWRSLEEPTQCIICAWTDDYEGEEEANRVRQIDPDDPLPLPEPNAGYSLTQARLNFGTNGTMYAPEDPQRTAFMEVFAYSQEICRMLEQIMADEASNTRENWREIYRTRAKILKAQGYKRFQ